MLSLECNKVKGCLVPFGDQLLKSLILILPYVRPFCSPYFPSLGQRLPSEYEAEGLDPFMNYIVHLHFVVLLFRYPSSTKWRVFLNF